jgi:hypothetical protein
MVGLFGRTAADIAAAIPSSRRAFCRRPIGRRFRENGRGLSKCLSRCEQGARDANADAGGSVSDSTIYHVGICNISIIKKTPPNTSAPSRSIIAPVKRKSHMLPRISATYERAERDNPAAKPMAAELIFGNARSFSRTKCSPRSSDVRPQAVRQRREREADQGTCGSRSSYRLLSF